MQTVSSQLTISEEAKLDTVMSVIEHSRTSLETKINSVASDMTLQQSDPCKLADRVAIAEQTLKGLQTQTSNVTTALQALQD
ncbi:hypothetical protein NDU88_002855 [Pleurodeles waltl]|uniref:Uncharacterized protein n=1 Tax=Pleurodeles waltl TaxID=8319 RepID=A0AAV7NPC3_PLEWA|nr:hypothetical protein NDU88_002855 [Pleurodeles waltl]